MNILEEKGLIQRIIDTKQKRLVKKVSLTDKGRELLFKIGPEIKQSYESLIEGISEEEIEILRKILEKLRNNLSEYTTIQI